MLEAQALTARRGAATLFAGLAFRVDAGRALFITGANGTGKTTLLRILAGLTMPAEGSVRWRGDAVAPFSPRLREDVVFIGHAPALKDELTAEENLRSLVELTATHPSDAEVSAALTLGRARRAAHAAGARAVAGTAAAHRARAARFLASSAVAARRAGDGARRRRARLARRR